LKKMECMLYLLLGQNLEKGSELERRKVQEWQKPKAGAGFMSRLRLVPQF